MTRCDYKYVSLNRTHDMVDPKKGLDDLVDLSPHKRIVYLVFLTSFAIQILSLAAPISFLVVIDKVIGNSGLTTLYSVVAGLVIATIMEALLMMARSYMISNLSTRIDVELSSTIFDHLMRLPLSFFSRMRVGDISLRFGDARQVRGFFVQSLPVATIELMFCVLYLIVLFIINVMLTFIVVGGIILIIILSLGFAPSEQRRAHTQSMSGIANQQLLVESIVGIETVKSLNIGDQFHQSWGRRLVNFGEATNYLEGSATVSRQLIEFVTRIAGASILGFGAIAILSQEMTLGQLIAFNLICMRLWMPIMRAAKLWQEYRTTVIAKNRLIELIDSPVEQSADQSLVCLDQIAGNITFENVSFSYGQPGTPPILNNASFDIAAGEVIGIQGISGSGKSTLARLIQGLYRPSEGRVYVDGHDLDLCDLNCIRGHIGSVLQDNNLFTGSVRHNILMGNPDLSIQEMVRICKLVGAHEFIIGLPNSYDTYIAERGQSLSMGQRQRIAWARALALDPKILILDEATSALDDISQSHILDNFDEITLGRTVLVIAHKEEILQKTSRRLTLTRRSVRDER